MGLFSKKGNSLKKHTNVDWTGGTLGEDTSNQWSFRTRILANFWRK